MNWVKLSTAFIIFAVVAQDCSVDIIDPNPDPLPIESGAATFGRVAPCNPKILVSGYTGYVDLVDDQGKYVYTRGGVGSYCTGVPGHQLWLQVALQTNKTTKPALLRFVQPSGQGGYNSCVDEIVSEPDSIITASLNCFWTSVGTRNDGEGKEAITGRDILVWTVGMKAK